MTNNILMTEQLQREKRYYREPVVSLHEKNKHLLLYHREREGEGQGQGQGVGELPGSISNGMLRLNREEKACRESLDLFNASLCPVDVAVDLDDHVPDEGKSKPAADSKET